MGEAGLKISPKHISPVDGYRRASLIDYPIGVSLIGGYLIGASLIGELLTETIP
jgi:hypothetical protein